MAKNASGLRRLKTTVVRNAVPKVYQDALASAGLYGRALDAQQRGHAAVAERMKQKAGQWARGSRTIPSGAGNWSGNSVHAVTNLDYGAAAARQATGAAAVAGKVGATPPIAQTLVGDALRAAPKAAPFLGKLAVPLTVVAAGVAAAQQGAKGYEKGGAPGAAVEGARGALDSVTMGLWSWASQKLEDKLVPPPGQRTPSHDARAPKSTREAKAPGSEKAPALPQKSQRDFASADRHYRDSHMQGPTDEQQVGPTDERRGFQRPKIQAAAQAAKGNNYTGPTE